ncbi:MAG: hypothetical protein F6K04_06995 [Leptolyngbya sp. SIO4C5]|nr:hypothetical protein [Leptolyngbya sp. SIO4C5]
MRKGSELLGLPVIGFDTGEQIRTVEDLLFDQDNNFLGFAVSSLPWQPAVLPLHGIQAIAPAAVIAISSSAIVQAKQDPRISQVLKQKLALQGTQIFTESGHFLGTITDVFFEPKTSKIEGYEVFGGLFAKLTDGYSFVPTPSSLKMGRHVAFVADAVSKQMTAAAPQIDFDRIERASAGQASGSSGGIHSGSHPLESSIFAESRSQSQAAAATLPTSGDRVASNGNSEAAAIETLEQLEMLIGSRVQQSIKTEESDYLAVRGQIVTQSVIDKVWIHRRQQALLQAIQSAEAPAAPFDLPPSAAQAMTPWQSWQAGLTRWQQRREQRQIEAVVGYPINRTLYDRQDRVILAKNEVITYQTVRQAQQAGVLSVLLNSVSS